MEDTAAWAGENRAIQGGHVTLSLESRRVGEITIVRCMGRIVEGGESAVLQQQVSELLALHPNIILSLDKVQFIDSSGLGLLVRLLNRARHARGNLELCAVPPRVAEVLRVTKLGSLFQMHDSEETAITHFHERASPGEPHRYKTDVLCAEKSADTLAYVGELLRRAGYGVLTTSNMADALTLWRATRPRLVVVGAQLTGFAGAHVPDAFRQVAGPHAVLELPADLASRDPGEAGRELIDHVRRALGNDPSAAG